MISRQSELVARWLLSNPEQIPVRLHQKRWGELAALVDFVGKGAPLPWLTRILHCIPCCEGKLVNSICEDGHA